MERIMSRKRARDPSDEDIGSPPMKRARCSVSSDCEDYKKFIKYVNCIENSSINQALPIPASINQEIGEYCIGELVLCANNECDVNICVLNKDIKDPHNAEWIYCDKNDKYFCKYCKPSTKEYDCNAIDMKGKDDCHYAIFCDECDIPLCFGSCADDFVLCQCDNQFCTKCYAENPSLLTTCILCEDQYCHLQINQLYQDYDEICTECNQFVCRKCLNEGWSDTLPFDMDWNSLHCLKDEEQQETKRLIRFVHDTDSRFHKLYYIYYPDRNTE